MTESHQIGSRPLTPYRGLAPYSAADASWFHGREREIHFVCANLMTSRATLLYGPTGVGKTSLLRAGVMPRLDEIQQSFSDSSAEDGLVDETVVIYLREWSRPMQAAFRSAAGSAVAEAVERLAAAKPSMTPAAIPTEFGSIAKLLSTIETQFTQCYVILDQFEEYFQYSAQYDADGKFLAELVQALGDDILRTHFLISLREDWISKLDTLKLKAPHLFDCMLRIEHLDREGAREAVLEPNELYQEKYGVQVSIEESFVDLLLDQLQDLDPRSGLTLDRAALQATESGMRETEQRISAAYLQLVMETLWQEAVRGKSKLTVAVLQAGAAGGRTRPTRSSDGRQETRTRSIVQNHVDDLLLKLSRREQAAASAVFDRLVTPSGGKYAQSFPNLLEWSGQDRGVLQSTLDKLCARESAILTRVAPDPLEPAEARYEVLHDILTGPILQWRERQIQSQKHGIWVKKMSILSAAVLSVVAMIVFVQFQMNRSKQMEAERATVQARRANAVQLQWKALSVAAGQQDTALLLACRGHTMLSSGDWRLQAIADPIRSTMLTLLNKSPRLIRVLHGHDAYCWALAVSKDQRTVAGGTSDGSVIIWDAETGNVINTKRMPAAGDIYSIAISPDGRSLIAGGRNHLVYVLAVPSLTLMRTIPGVEDGHDNIIRAVAFDPIGERFATGDDNGHVRLFDARTGRLRSTIVDVYQDVIWGLSFSRGDDRLAVACNTGRAFIASVSATADLNGPSGLHRLEGNTSPDYSRIFKNVCLMCLLKPY